MLFDATEIVATSSTFLNGGLIMLRGRVSMWCRTSAAAV
jgi:hypothetical protein